MRREVLGADYVDDAIRTADDFNRPLQELVTEYCWGAVWGRPGLPRKTRSMLNLAMLTALNRPHELKLHVKGALKNGLSREEIMEVLLQAAIYWGVPAAVDAFRTAREACCGKVGHSPPAAEPGGAEMGSLRRRREQGARAAGGARAGAGHDARQCRRPRRLR